MPGALALALSVRAAAEAAPSDGQTFARLLSENHRGPPLPRPRKTPPSRKAFSLAQERSARGYSRPRLLHRRSTADGDALPPDLDPDTMEEGPVFDGPQDHGPGPRSPFLVEAHFC